MAIAALGGLSVAVQGRINGELGKRLDDGVFAALVSFGVGLVLLLVLVAVNPGVRAGVRRLGGSLRSGTLRPWQVLGGVCGAVFVAAQGLTITALGVAVFTVASVAGQVGASLLVDRAGIGPAGRAPVTAPRAASAALAVVAVVVAVSGKHGGSGQLWLAVLPLLAGVGLAWQAGVNGRLSVAAGEPKVAVLVNFSVGIGALAVACVIDLVVNGWPDALPTQWWLYVGGVLGIVGVFTSVIAVGMVGVLVVMLGMVGGQLLGAVALDIVVPPTGGGLSVRTVIGAALTLVAVAVAGIRTGERMTGVSQPASEPTNS